MTTYIPNETYSSSENYQEKEAKVLNDDTNCIEINTRSETDLTRLDEIEQEDDIVFRPTEEALPGTPIKRKSASFNWKSKRNSKPTKVRTKRLYGTSGVDTDPIVRDSNHLNAPKFCFASSFRDPNPDNSSFGPTQTSFTKLKPVGSKFRRDNRLDLLIPELPTSSTLLHLGKTRPKRRKTYKPIKRAVFYS